jgi:N-acetylmuramoyl-L-alanine amidase
MKKLLTTLTLAASVFMLSHSAHASSTYTIKNGDSLSGISKKFHVSLKALKAANHISGNFIRIGDHLTIPSSVSSSQNRAHSLQYKVKRGDTLWDIAMSTGTSFNNIKNANHLKNNRIREGQSLVLPQLLTQLEKNLLTHLVSAEAKGEPYAGQVAVATVILNRVDSSKFPNTLKGVVYQKTGSHYAFTPVKTGSLNKAPTASVVKAVNEALAMRDRYKGGSLYYFNPKIITSKWVLTRPVTVRIGHQTFAK